MDYRLWWTVAFNPRTRKWEEVEHLEQIVGEYPTKADAEAASASREDGLNR